MGKEKFRQNYVIGYQSVDESLRASFPGFMGYIQETSLLHGKAAGYPLEYFYKEGTGFVLASWEIEIYAYPKWGDEIIVETWPSLFKGIVGERSFEAKTPAGQILLRAESKWAYTNIRTRKYQKITEEMARNYGPVFERVLEKTPKAQSEESFTLLAAAEFSVKRSAIDSNGHVNNISYLRWAADNIPDEIITGREPARVMAKYTKQCLLNDRVLVETYISPEREGRVLSIVRNPEKPEEIYCSVNIDFRKA